MKSRILCLVLSVWTLIISVTLAAASTENRVALVIGNQNYASAGTLKNPINDARAVSDKLESLGFDVLSGTDLTYDAMRDTVREFTRKARKADVTVFYYAGHGIDVEGKNYIVPVDAKLDDAVDWEFEVYAIAEILRLIDRSPGPSLVFLDACRDNPLASVLANAQGMSSRSMNSRGISRIPTETMGTTGSVIAYATEPGQVAADGTGNNSPFALALVNHLDTENTDFASITSLITRDVMEMTDGVQRPRFDVSLTGPLVLNERVLDSTEVASLDPELPVQDAKPTPETPASTDLVEVEKFMFETAMASKDIADFNAFLQAFPNSVFAPMAQNAISRIEKEERTAQETEQVASLDTSELAQASRFAQMPLALGVTPQVQIAPSGQATENALAMNKTQRRAVQLRLNLAGFNVGSPDGSFGRKTRTGISSWQTANQFAATGYLNNVQHQLLTASTHSAFQAHLASNPNALQPVASASSGNSRNTQRNNGNFIKGFATGVGAAILLKRK